VTTGDAGARAARGRSQASARRGGKGAHGAAATKGAEGGLRLRDAERSRRRLLDAAELEFEAKGFGGARLGDIARGAHVQAALVHHYFHDKEGLFRAVIERGLAAVTEQSWGLVGKLGTDLDAAAADPRHARALVVDFVDRFVAALSEFHATHGRVLRILWHEAQAGRPYGAELIEKAAKPVFEAVVRRVESLGEAGVLRAGIDARQTCLSVLAMCAFPFQEEAFVRCIWPINPRDPAFAAARRREVVAMLLARILPA
jgi:TetR/AcrR family transcriptional regulator